VTSKAAARRLVEVAHHQRTHRGGHRLWPGQEDREEHLGLRSWRRPPLRGGAVAGEDMQMDAI
jgi:hypothetical protein